MSKSFVKKSLLFAGGFAVLNVAMYALLARFWIGGSSFLPMVGVFSKVPKAGDNFFLLAFIVNIGVITGSFIGAKTSGEFRLRMPKSTIIPRAILGGILIGIGITLCPGTCTTSFVTGMPMLSVSSFLSGAGIFIGAYIVFKLTKK